MQKGNIGVTTENIFPVIKKFLYSDHEIFLRELVSNAVDATQKLKTLASTGVYSGELGAINIDRIGRNLRISDETLTLVEHMLISHHGTPEFGAAKMPMFIEAELLSQLDLLDARLYEMNHAVNEVEVGAFTPRQWALENRNLYNHGRAAGEGINLIEG